MLLFTMRLQTAGELIENRDGFDSRMSSNNGDAAAAINNDASNELEEEFVPKGRYKQRIIRANNIRRKANPAEFNQNSSLFGEDNACFIAYLQHRYPHHQPPTATDKMSSSPSPPRDHIMRVMGMIEVISKLMRL